jgi:TPR repeat protein
MFLTRFKKPILISLCATIPLSYIYFSGHQPKLISKFKKVLFPKTPQELEEMYNEGVKCFNRLQTEKAIRLLKIAAEYGHVDSAVNLCYLYMNGERGVKRDYKQAFKYGEIAAELDSAPALNNLGIMYETGLYVKQDREKAIQYLTRASEKEYSISQYNLAKLYLEGNHSKDSKKGLELLIKSAEQGYVDAQAYLGKYYVFKLQDYEKGVYWLKKGADQNSYAAINNLGICYLNGFGVSIFHNKNNIRSQKVKPKQWYYLKKVQNWDIQIHKTISVTCMNMESL